MSRVGQIICGELNLTDENLGGRYGALALPMTAGDWAHTPVQQFDGCAHPPVQAAAHAVCGSNLMAARTP